ncbi:hypothetical protein ACLOAV_005034 [Pseudogymnoascus australis]
MLLSSSIFTFIISFHIHLHSLIFTFTTIASSTALHHNNTPARSTRYHLSAAAQAPQTPPAHHNNPQPHSLLPLAAATRSPPGPHHKHHHQPIGPTDVHFAHAALTRHTNSQLARPAAAPTQSTAHRRQVAHVLAAFAILLHFGIKHRDRDLQGELEEQQCEDGGKKAQKDDWSGVNEPDERRRIQNRLAQRKFREKAKDQKESRDRDAENQLHAGYSYTSPDPDDLCPDTELSGLPWGGPSMRHIVERGKVTQGGSRQGSRDYSFYEVPTVASEGLMDDLEAAISAPLPIPMVHNSP